MDTPVQIKTGQFQILASGQAIVLANEESSILFGKDPGSLTLSFTFREDGKEPRMESNQRKAQELFLTFWNFNNSLGLGNVEPLEIGTMTGEKLFFSYRIFSLTDKTMRTIEYTFYFKKV